MNKSILRFGLIILAAAFLSGCTGNDDNNPGRYYLESNRPCPIEQVAQNLPSDMLSSETTVKLYTYNNGQRQLLKTSTYAANTVNAAKVLRDLPTSGHYYVEAQLKNSVRALTYKAELQDAQITWQ